MTRNLNRIAVTAAALMLALTGCAGSGEPSPSGDPGGSPSVVPPTAPAPSPSEEPTLASDDIELPGDCAQLFDAAFIAQMDAVGLPLNDPGLTMGATFAEAPLALLDEIPTLRCTWGMPSEVGVATHVSIVSPEQRAELLAVYETGFDLDGTPAVFDCVELGPETRCGFTRTETDQDGAGWALGEAQVFRGNAWITTAWLNTDAAGDAYLDSITTALWD